MVSITWLLCEEAFLVQKNENSVQHIQLTTSAFLSIYLSKHNLPLWMVRHLRGGPQTDSRINYDVT